MLIRMLKTAASERGVLHSGEKYELDDSTANEFKNSKAAEDAQTQTKLPKPPLKFATWDGLDQRSIYLAWLSHFQDAISDSDEMILAMVLLFDELEIDPPVWLKLRAHQPLIKSAQSDKHCAPKQGSKRKAGRPNNGLLENAQATSRCFNTFFLREAIRHYLAGLSEDEKDGVGDSQADSLTAQCLSISIYTVCAHKKKARKILGITDILNSDMRNRLSAYGAVVLCDHFCGRTDCNCKKTHY